MTKGKGTRRQIIQWPKPKGQEDHKYIDQRLRDNRRNNTMTKGKETTGQIMQWPKPKGQEDK